MTSEEIKAAAERLMATRKLPGCPWESDVYQSINPNAPRLQYQSDLVTVSDAFLGHHYGALKPLAEYGWVEHEQGYWCVITPIGAYNVNEGGMSWWRVGSGVVRDIVSVEEGKADCQSDFEQQVASLFSRIGG